MLQKIKDWLILILLAIVGLLSALVLSKRPKWVKEKEKEIEGRGKNINQLKKNTQKTETDYKEMMKDHDTEIENVRKGPGKPDINDPDVAAKYLDDILSNKGK